MNEVVFDFESCSSAVVILFPVKQRSTLGSFGTLIITASVEPAVAALFAEINDVEGVVCTCRIIDEFRFIICFHDE